ncbi:translation initiation factor IF-2 associated domain-containing protein, partial [uncultured Oceanicoccus sp.]|uniref:translation initiation factor IF-2 associated domain-containing protein n=1 Tax=uncultured Oceanicoccus sp. TaxID=1706381 RepID=UPI0030DBEACB
MAEVTVSQLAEVVGAPVDRLLAQMKQAGLKHTSVDEVVSDEDKQTLLSFLKTSHGESTAAPKKITLKRKTLSTLKTSGSQGRKTVNVEVRKKRTYVKRDPAELLAESAAAEAESSTETPASAVEGAAAEPLNEAPVAATEEFVEEVVQDKSQMDPEVLRQHAAAKRKDKEAKDKELQQAATAAKKAEQERAEKLKATNASADGKPIRRRHEEPGTAKDKADDFPEKKKKKSGKLTPKTRGKNRTHNIKDIDAFMDGDGVDSRGRRKQHVLKLPEGAKTHGFAR